MAGKDNGRRAPDGAERSGAPSGEAPRGRRRAPGRERQRSAFASPCPSSRSPSGISANEHRSIRMAVHSRSRYPATIGPSLVTNTGQGGSL